MECLNIDLVKSRMKELGLSQRELSRQIQLSVETLSQWLSGDNFPHPKNLLELGKALNLPYKHLVISEAGNEPVVAFRKRRNSKTTDQHIQRAQEMGRSLECLAPHLPFDKLSRPPALIDPKPEYHYVQAAAQGESDGAGRGRRSATPPTGW